MRPSTSMQSLGLVLAGFVIGIIVANLGLAGGTPGSDTPGQKTNPSYPGSYMVVARTGVWDVLTRRSEDGRSVALGQNGFVRVVVRDDESALYVMTYKPGDDVWQGRLMDVGNDGTVEVADISYGHCEAFSPPATGR